ncbi:hypothetical protein MNBD_UNCLBAC01-56 [hydrothermal vent metagenome]|uniref:Uncharacterized protein n=1 Tax=hydrothermal vent metagenome TaxID=652676 RepID=A0A3B1D555_9ZZZZ
MNEESGYFNDDGTPFNPNLIPKPSLCATCKNNSDSKQEILCALNRHDQSEDMFMCFSYEPNSSQIDGKAVIQEMQDYMDHKYNNKQG